MNYDTNRVSELVEKYKETETRQERRAIEDEILEATVWQESTRFENSEEQFATYSRKELERISDAIETDDKEIQALLRKPYIKLL